jgi:hypothetical protein
MQFQSLSLPLVLTEIKIFEHIIFVRTLMKSLIYMLELSRIKKKLKIYFTAAVEIFFLETEKFMLDEKRSHKKSFQMRLKFNKAILNASLSSVQLCGYVKSC